MLGDGALAGITIGSVFLLWVCLVFLKLGSSSFYKKISQVKEPEVRWGISDEGMLRTWSTPVQSKVGAKPNEQTDPEASLSSIKQTEPDASSNSNKQMEPEENLGATYEGISIVPPSVPQNNPAFDVKQEV
mmetsp:Transcript_34666/g.60947  ORF Transcript_34666/g.60947 Transcript_34666/m.60947 type:complete len:131 (+) Transcript_34666:1360-1752(+)